VVAHDAHSAPGVEDVTAMFVDYAADARQALAHAFREAQAMGHRTVNTGHLLLGLLTVPGCLACQALEALGVTPEALSEAARAVCPPPAADGEHPGQPQPTWRLRRVLKHGSDEAAALGQDAGTAHLLLGLLREGQGTGTAALARVGVPAAAVRDQVLALLHKSG
jgi:ATP-dependent Clp protease ATP-binding subunit ClpC